MTNDNKAATSITKKIAAGLRKLLPGNAGNLRRLPGADPNRPNQGHTWGVEARAQGQEEATALDT